MEGSEFEIDKMILPSLVSHLKSHRNERNLALSLEATEILVNRHGEEFFEQFIVLGGLARCLQLYKISRSVELVHSAAQVISLYVSSPNFFEKLWEAGNQLLMTALVISASWFWYLIVQFD